MICGFEKKIKDQGFSFQIMKLASYFQFLSNGDMSLVEQNTALPSHDIVCAMSPQRANPSIRYTLIQGAQYGKHSAMAIKQHSLSSSSSL